MAEEINKTAHSGLRFGVILVGNRNAGKSSLLNKIVGQNAAIVSDTKGTTTDVVIKPYELEGVGAVSFYDTAGIDDEGQLGQLRIEATEKALRKADAVLLVIGKDGLTDTIQDYLDKFISQKINFIPVFNFADVRELSASEKMLLEKYNGIAVSAFSGLGVESLKQKLALTLKPMIKNDKTMIEGMVNAGDIVVLVIPQDIGAPKGRLIMPQVQAMREIMDVGAIGIMCKETELGVVLKPIKPDLVICDSQVVKKVADVLPNDIRLTTFSILLSRAKGNFELQLEGAKTLDTLQDGDEILIAEGCSHHISCEDIGRVKLPRWIEKYSGKNIKFTFMQGTDFPDNLTHYKLVLMCGGCVLNKAENQRRLAICEAQNVPVTNYGLAISKLQGVLARATENNN